MNSQEPKGPRAAISRLIEHLNRYPDDVGLLVAGLFVVFILFFLIYGIGWHEGYGVGREAKDYPPPPGLEELQHYLNGLRK